MFIPVNQEAQDRVNTLLAKQKIFQDVDQFILFYNQGVINVNNDSIKDLAEEIDKSYLNIFLQNRKFYIQSKTEVELKKIDFLLSGWDLVAVLKRIARNLEEDDYLPDTKIIFIEEKRDQVFLEGETDEEGNITLDSFEKYNDVERFNLTADKVAKNILLQGHLQNYPDFDNVSYVTIGALNSIDDSVIHNLHNVITQYFSNNHE